MSVFPLPARCARRPRPPKTLLWQRDSPHACSLKSEISNLRFRKRLAEEMGTCSPARPGAVPWTDFFLFRVLRAVSLPRELAHDALPVGEKVAGDTVTPPFRGG